MSGAVGSKPALTRSGLPVFCARFSFSASSSSRMISMAPRRMYSSWSLTGIVVKSFITPSYSPPLEEGWLHRRGSSLKVLRYDDTPALNLAPSRQHHIDGLRINSMFFLQDPRRQRLRRIAVQYGDNGL